jgi:integrase
LGKVKGMREAAQMARTLNRLSALKVERAKQPGLWADGGGLYLRVAEGGSKQWIFRYAANGRQRDMGIGPAHTVSLVQAREKARDARLLRLEGVDPIESKRARMAALRAADARAMTFADCTRGYIKDNESDWGSARHRHEWLATLSRYAFPLLGSLPVEAIDTPLVLKVIKPLWERIPVTGTRVLGRIESVLGWATVHHYRHGDNPARWQGHLEHALPAVVKTGRHLAALPYVEAPVFMARLRQDSGAPSACLRFLALTAARLGEALGATWDEVDLGGRVWTVPATRMKAGREHRVPLSPAATAVLESMRAIRDSDYIFPGTRQGRPIGENTIWRLCKEAAGSDITVHGLRSTFRDWAAERSNFPREVAEMALAHAIPNAVEAAYRRGDLFEKRRKLMDAWAEYCGKPSAVGTVVPIGVAMK